MTVKKFIITAVILLAGLFAAITGSEKEGTGAGSSGKKDNLKSEVVRLQVQNGHSDWVHSVAFSPNGKYIASGSWDNTIKLLSIDNRLLKTFEVKSWVKSVVFSPNEKYIASGSLDNTIKLWSIDGNLIKTFKGHSDSVNSVVFSPDGKYIASGSSDKTIKLWSIDGNLIKTFKGHSDSINGVAFSPDGKYIASGSSDKTIKLWSLDGNLIKTFEGHLIGILSVAFSPDGEYIVSGSHDKTIKLWSLNGRILHTFQGHSESVESVIFSPDGKKIASGSRDKTIKLWSADGNLLRTFEGHTGFIKSVVFNPKGNSIASGSSDKTIKIWNIDGTLLRTFKENSDNLLNITISPDGKIIASLPTENIIKLWSIDGIFFKTLTGHSGKINCVVFSPDMKTIASGSDDRTIKLWSTDGKFLKTFEGNMWEIKTLIFNPDGKTIVSAEPDDIKLWDIDGKLLKTFIGHTSSVCSLDFSPDGKYFVSGSLDNTIKLWSIDGKLLKTFEGHRDIVYSVCFSPDGNNIASGSFDNTIKLWSIDGNLLKTFEGHIGYVLKVSFSPDGKSIVSGSSDKTIKLWSIDGNLLKTFEGHSNGINRVGFYFDGRSIISASFDGTIKIWSTKTGECLVTYIACEDNTIITYTPDYYYRLSGDAVNAVAFVKNMKAYGFDQFDLRHNRPDIVLERLYPDLKTRPKHIQDEIKRYRRYWEYRVAKNGFTPEQVSGKATIHAPEVFGIKLNGNPVEVTAEDKKRGVKEADTVFSSGEVNLSFQIRDEEGSGLNVIGYKVFVNGVPVHGQYIKRFRKKKKVQEVTERIILSSVPDAGTNPGDNKLEISGFTEDGIESKRECLYLRYDGAHKNARGDLYIVAIGVNDYSKGSGFQSLTYAEGDADDIVSAFSESCGNKYRKIIPLVYKGSEVNRDIISSLKEKLIKTTVNDTVIFFMSGHGIRADTDKAVADKMANDSGIGHSIGDITGTQDKVNIYYFMTGDSSAGKPWEKGIPIDVIRSALDGIPPRQKLLLIDTCQSGEKPVFSGYMPSEDKLEEVRKKRSALASDKKDKSVKLIRGAGYNEKGMIMETACNLDMKEMSDMFPELRRGTGTIEISASTGNQSALESSEWKNGAFTYVVKEAILKGLAKNSSGKITAKSLRSYVLKRVEELTEGDQTPMVCRDIAGRDFVVGE